MPALVARLSLLQLLPSRQLQILAVTVDRLGAVENAFTLDLSEKTVVDRRAPDMEPVAGRHLLGLVLLAVRHGLTGKAI